MKSWLEPTKNLLTRSIFNFREPRKHRRDRHKISHLIFPKSATSRRRNDVTKRQTRERTTTRTRFMFYLSRTMADLDVFRVGIGVFEAGDFNAIVPEGRNRTDFAENRILVVFRLSDFEN